MIIDKISLASVGGVGEKAILKNCDLEVPRRRQGRERKNECARNVESYSVKRLHQVLSLVVNRKSMQKSFEGSRPKTCQQRKKGVDEREKVCV